LAFSFLSAYSRRNAGSQAALTAKLPRQPLTSHPSVKAQLENGLPFIHFT
jgi:hypothetical protein